MANTAELLTLISEFSTAFADPEDIVQSSRQDSTKPLSDNTQKLLDLMQDFPEAFADPEAQTASTPLEALESQTIAPSQETTPTSDTAPSTIALPAGYHFALQRQFSTFTWGTIAVSLTYSDKGLQSIWVTAGKSGTEIQSLCEGICRLANLLLAHNVPTSAIARELRGIRGADSEGLGPHRILGLVDLIGKALQEAPETFHPSETTSTASPNTEISHSPAISTPVASAEVNLSDSFQSITQPSPPDNSLTQAWANVSDHNHRMGVCPECGSDLQAANGCSGGACIVCGYSSCH